METNKRWMLCITYPVSLAGPPSSWFPLDKFLEPALGHAESSGFGFGERDLEYTFDDETAAKAQRLTCLGRVPAR
jgi:hypothetical protein